MEENYTNHTLITTINPINNEIIKQDKYTKTSINQKAKGYSLVYLDNLREIFLYLKNVKEVYILLDLLEVETSKDYSLDISYKDLMRAYKMTRNASQEFITVLKKYGVIRGSRGKYRVNPYYVVPKGISDLIVAKYQRRWDSDNTL